MVKVLGSLLPQIPKFQKLIQKLFLTIILLSSCSKADIKYEYPENPDIVRKSRAGKYFNNDLVLFGQTKNSQSSNSKTFEAKEKTYPLWSASLEVIGDLLPISAVDINSGVILTDWYQDPEDKKNRIKINLLVKSREIKADSLVISIFRQKLNSKQNWQDDRSSNDLSARLIKAKIIERAKQK